jgi:tetratricopeptide (TPR) repeat protein
METQTQHREAAKIAVATVVQGTALPKRAIFRKEGEYWTVGRGGKSFRLKDTKGLGYLAHLLRHPAVEFHVLDLAGGIGSQSDDDETSLPRGEEDLEKAGIHVRSLGDAGEMLDDQAKATYRRRLSELREELERAKERGNVERAEQAEQEIDALTKELSRAVGLGGRNRKAASASERARQSISKTIKTVLERIAQSDAALGDILSRCIKTGAFCSYQPDPNFPITWEFAAMISDSPQSAIASADSALPRVDMQASPAQTPPVLEVSPFLFAERTAFVGRETERGTIRALMDRARSGQGSLIMLGGGPGVGKSRLAMDMAEYASSVGFRFLVGHCYERDEPFPYLPFAEMLESNLARAASLDDFRQRMGDHAVELAQIAPSLRRAFPDLPQPLELPAAQKRRYIFQSVSEAMALAARRRPQLYILEDLQWADESTLGLLIHLANRVAHLPVVIMGTYRDQYTENNPALVRSLEELIRMGVRPFKIGGLSQDAVAQMLQGLSQRQVPESLVSLIFEESQGNPFFVEEVYRHLIDEGRVFDEAGEFRTDIEIAETDVPESVRLIIGRRMARLDENEMRVLAAAAVIGRSFSFQLLSAISQIDVDELFTVIEKAQEMGVIVPSSEGPETPFTFAHELVRQTLLAGISAPRQEQLHASVAAAIEGLYPQAAKERAGEIAHHLIKAGSFADEQKLVRNLTLAGKNALRATAFEEAERNFQSALSHNGAFEARERADLLANLARAERGLDRWDAVLTNLREALEIYVKLGDRKTIVRTVNELTEALFWAGRFQEATETAQRGLSYLPADVSADRARLFATLGQARAAGGEYEPASEALDEALNIASQLTDSKLVAGLLGARCVVNFHFFRLKEAVEDGFSIEQLAGSDLPPWLRALQLLSLHMALLDLGRLKESLSIADELEPLARKIGHSLSVAWCHSTRVWIDFGIAPDLAKLDASFDRERKFNQEASSAHLEALSEVQLSLVDFFRGDWTSARVHAQASRRPDPGRSMEGFGVGTLFLHMAYAGDRDGALAILDEKRALLPRSGQPNSIGSWWMLALVIEGLVILGEQSQAAQLYPLARELIATGAVVVHWPILRFTNTIAGIAAAAARQWEAAEDHFHIALQQAESFPNVLEQAEINRFRAMMLIDRNTPGDRRNAKTLLGNALETYMNIGMPRHSDITRALLQETYP